MQHQPREVFLIGFVPVKGVAHDGVADAEKMGADLVLAAGQRVDPNQRVARHPLRHGKFGAARLSAGLILPHPAGTEAPQRRFDHPGIPFNGSMHQCHIRLVHLALLELEIEMAVGFGVFSEEDDPAHLFVQAVDHEKFALKGIVQDLEQRDFFAVALRDRCQFLGLVDGDQVVVFKDDGMV